MKIKWPCNKCESKYPGCHDKCHEYQEKKQELEDEKRKIREAKGVDNGMRGYAKDKGKRLKKWRKET